jgi:hypothetical protein
MPTSTQFPWHGLAIVVGTVLSLYLLIALALKIAEWVSAARDELRDRYGSTRWKPVPIDIIAVPLWIALELLCFVAGFAFALLMVFVAYQAAKGVRDWWHAGDRGRAR